VIPWPPFFRIENRTDFLGGGVFFFMRERIKASLSLLALIPLIHFTDFSTDYPVGLVIAGHLLPFFFAYSPPPVCPCVPPFDPNHPD